MGKHFFDRTSNEIFNRMSLNMRFVLFFSISSDDNLRIGGIATFVCVCDSKSQSTRLRGSLSAIMEEPLSTIPLHMVINGQVNARSENF